MKRRHPLVPFLALLLSMCLFLSLPVSTALAEKRTDFPAVFETSVETVERKEDAGRYFISKEYLNTVNESVNAELRAVADAYDEALFPTMQPDAAKNARRNSRLDIETVYYITGDSWLSTMVLARVSYQRKQVCSPFTTAVYDLETGEKIALTDLFAPDSEAWALLEGRVREHVSSLFVNAPRNPDAVEALCTREALEDASFTLSGMELTLHYEAQTVYPGQAGLMHVRFFYDELWPMMTDVARRQTDNTDWKMVAFTCDDGPSYGPTSNTLVNLRHAGARATFFTVGKKAAGSPDILMRQFDQNHIIASHSYNHWSGYTMKPETRLKEIADHNALLAQYTGEPVSLFRAPGGTYPPWIEADIGLPIIQWSVDTYDYTGKDAKHIFYSVRNNVQDGDVILMHDSGAELYKAIPLMADYLRQNGYMMVTVEELAHRNGVTLMPNKVYYRFLDGETGKRTDSNT